MRYKYKHIEAHSVSEYLKYLKKGFIRLSIDNKLLDSLIFELNGLKDKEKVFLFEYCYQLLAKDYEKNKNEVLNLLMPYKKDVFASYVLGLIDKGVFNKYLIYSSKKDLYPQHINSLS